MPVPLAQHFSVGGIPHGKASLSPRGTVPRRGGAASGAAVEAPAPPSPVKKMTLGFAFTLEAGIP